VTGSFLTKVLRKVSRLASREDGAQPLFIPSACSGTCNVELRIYNHQLELFLRSKCKNGAGKIEKTCFKAAIISIGVG